MDRKSFFFRNRLWIFILFLLVLILSIFSSSLPDGLEWAMEQLHITPEKETPYSAPMADYSVSRKLPSGMNSILAGIIGAAVTAGLIYLVYRIQRYSSSQKDSKK